MKIQRCVKAFSFIMILAMLVCIIPNIMAHAAGIRISKKKLSLEIEQTARLRITGTSGDVIWESSDDSVATVNKNGKVIAVGVGNATITGTYKNKKFSCAVTVSESFELSEVDLAEILDGRMVDVLGQDIQVISDEISEITINSISKSTSGKSVEVLASAIIDKSLAVINAEIELSFEYKNNEWKLSGISISTEVVEWTIEGTWKGSINVYDYSRSKAESRELLLEISDVKDDGYFTCEASFIGKQTDILSMTGNIDADTGYLKIKGLNWIQCDSACAKKLNAKGKMFSIYALADFENDTFISDYAKTTKNIFTSDLDIEQLLEDYEDEDGENDSSNLDDYENREEEGFEYEY